MNKARMVYVIALLLILLGGVWGWLPSVTERMKKEILPPAMPVWPKALSAAMDKQILARNLWQQDRGQKAVVSDKALHHAIQLSSWVLMAIGQTEQINVAMIRANGEVATYYAGDTLPDGRKLLKVFLDGVLVYNDKKKASEYVYLFGKKSS